MDTQKTINEIIGLLTVLWEDYPTETQEQVDAKEDLRQRIDALEQNPSSAEISLRGWTELGDIYLADKKAWADQRAKLEKAKKDAETLTQAKETELATAKKEIAEKLTPELITKIGELAGKNLELKRIPKKDAQGKELKDANGNTVYEEIVDLAKLESAILAELKKQEPATVSLTEADTKKLAAELKKEAPTNYWSIGACVMGGLSLIASLFLVVKKTTEEK
jgi:hypothetical protein